MANNDTPPVSQHKIDAERNESKELVSMQPHWEER